MMAKARKFHFGSAKYYSFKPLKDKVYASDTWELEYAPEVMGMGRYDYFTLTFKRDTLVRIVMRSGLAP